MQVPVVTSLFLIHLFDSVICTTWNYVGLGADVWSDIYPSCAGEFQSPINIRTACTVYQSLPPFQFSSAYNSTNSFLLEDVEYSIIMGYMNNNSSPLRLTGGGLNGTYEFFSMHLHWGENYRSGSEHQINGMKYAGEIHFIHRNPITNNFAVLGIFMASSRDNTTNRSTIQTENSTINEWKRYIASAISLKTLNSSTVIGLNLASLMGNNLNDFWRYKGSLTIPPCTEGIVWTVFKVPIVFDEAEIEKFRQNLFLIAYRDPQPLYYRTVYRNFVNEQISSIPDYNLCPKSLDNNSAKGLFNQNIYLLIFIKIISIRFFIFQLN